MPQAIKFTPKTRMVVATKTGQSTGDVNAQLEVAAEMQKSHGDCYYVFDYPTQHEQVPFALMHQAVFDEYFEFIGDASEAETRFVPVKSLKIA